MAMGKRSGEQQGTFWIPTSELPSAPGHPFYERLNQILDGHGFDGFVVLSSPSAAINAAFVRTLMLSGG